MPNKDNNIDGLPENLPCGFFNAIASFKDDHSDRVACIFVKHRNRDKYTMHPYIDHASLNEKLRYKRIKRVWQYQPISPLNP